MPIVDYEAAFSSRIGTQEGVAQPTDEHGPEVGTLDLWAAALRQNNVASQDPEASAKFLAAPLTISKSAFSLAAKLAEPTVYDPNYDPLTPENLAGYEEHAQRFIAADSAAESQQIKQRIDIERADMGVIQQAGMAGLATSIAAGMLDPVTVASMAIPGVGEAQAATRLGRIGRMVATSAAFDTGQEAILHANQELRTAEQSLLNIGAGTLLTGALGVVATRMGKNEFEQLAEVMRRQSAAMSAPAEGIESTGGAARVGFGTTLEDETVAKGGEAILNSVGKISPLGRVMQASSKRARILMQEMANVPFLLNKHLKGIATPRSAEGEILAAQADRYRLIQDTEAAFAEHKAAGGKLSRKGFREELAMALRRGDESIEPGVSKVAAKYRAFFDESLADLKKAGLLAEDAGVEHAISYLPRIYDHAKIRANRGAFEDALTDYFSRSGQVELAEVRTAVADVIDTVDGLMRGHAQLDNGFVASAGALKGRTLKVPDEVLEPWLVNDVDKIMEHYIRSVTPQLVLKRKFGDLDLRQPMQDVRDEYVALRERAGSNEAKDRITQEMKRTLHDLQSVRDLLLGKYGLPANPDSKLIKTGRAFRALNYVRLLGGQVLSSVPDAGRVVARHGLVKTAKTIAKLVADSGFRQMTKAEAKRVGTALEYVLNTRGDTLAEIGDQVEGTKFDSFVRKTSNNFSRVTGMASWNSALKTLAVALEQDAIVRAARGGKLSKFQRGQLASLGIDDRMLDRISKQLDEHASGAEDAGTFDEYAAMQAGVEPAPLGETVTAAPAAKPAKKAEAPKKARPLDDGMFRANTEHWTDKEAAAALEGALLKSADQVVLTKGIADVPLLMNKEIGKTIFQFKSFGMASVNRLLIPMAQGLSHGDLATINGAWMMMALGALANATRDYAAGFKPATDPTRIAIEAFDRAGFTTFMAEPFDIVSGTLGGPRFGRFTSQSIEETIAGPTFGTIGDIRQTLQGMFTEGGKFDPHVKASDVYRFRKLLPYQNLFYVRRLVNALEGEFSELAGAEGAGAQSLADRFTQTKDLAR